MSKTPRDPCQYTRAKLTVKHIHQDRKMGMEAIVLEALEEERRITLRHVMDEVSSVEVPVKITDQAVRGKGFPGAVELARKKAGVELQSYIADNAKFTFTNGSGYRKFYFKIQLIDTRTFSKVVCDG